METFFFSITLLFLTYKILYSEKDYKTIFLLFIFLSYKTPRNFDFTSFHSVSLSRKIYETFKASFICIFAVYSSFLLVEMALLWRCFPSSFYVKFGNALQGSKAFLSFLFHSFPLLVLIAAHGTWEEKIYTTFLYLSSTHFFMSNLIMNFSNRFLYHIFPALSLISAKIVERKIKSLRKTLMLSLIVLVFFVNLNDMTLISVYGWNMAHSYAILGKTLHNCNISHSYRKMLLGDIGLIGYFSDWYILDYWGLGSVHFAKANESKRLKVINQTHPSLLFLYSMNGISP